MKKITKKLSFITMMFLMLTTLCFNYVSAAEKADYEKFSGTIVNATQGAKRIITVESDDGTRMNFDIFLSAYIDSAAKTTINSKVTCFYDKNESSSMHSAVAIVDNSTMVSAYLSRFDDNLLDDKKSLYISVNDKTEIITKDGKKYTGDIKNKDLLIFYTIVAESYPAQTTPSKVVVMEDNSATPSETPKSNYEKFSGKITALVKSKNKTTITVQSNNKQKRTFEILNSTYKDSSVKIAKNARVTCFYDKSKVSSSKYTALAITNTSNSTTVFLGKFNSNLVDEANTLKLVNTNKSSIISKTGKKYSGSVKNKTLLVFYTISTRSIPAQTTPSKIVVL